MLSEEFEVISGRDVRAGAPAIPGERGEPPFARAGCDDCEAACLQNVHPHEPFFVP